MTHPIRLSSLALIAALAASPAGAASPESPPEARRAIGEASGAALQADSGQALRAIGGLDPAGLVERDRAFVLCMRGRFGPGGADPDAGIADPLAREALGAYRTYWRGSMREPAARQAEEAGLAASLGRLLGRPGAEMDVLEPELQRRLDQAGYRSLQGRTGLLRELMMWTRQDSRDVRVELPEGAHTARVHYLDGFVSFGWGHYATCGRAATGGWATKDALFAVVPRYDSLESEEFKVTFLGHETQHFADLARYPDLKPWELEYRAKLTELALADTTRAKVLRKIAEDQGDDPASPHSYAGRRVLTALRARLGLAADGDLGAVDGDALRKAAVAELRADSARRAGA